MSKYDAVLKLLWLVYLRFSSWDKKHLAKSKSRKYSKVFNLHERKESSAEKKN